MLPILYRCMVYETENSISKNYPIYFNFSVLDSSFIKGSLQWKNDLGLYCSLTMVMDIGMCDLVIFCLV